MTRSQFVVFMLAIVSYSTMTAAPELQLRSVLSATTVHQGGRSPASESLLGGEPEDSGRPKKSKVSQSDESSAADEAATDVPACGVGWENDAKLVGAKFARFLGARGSGLKRAVLDEKDEGAGQPELTLVPSSSGKLFARLRVGALLDITESAKACMLGESMKVEVDNSRATGMAAYAGSKIIMLFSTGRGPGSVRVRATVNGTKVDSNFTAEAAN